MNEHRSGASEGIWIGLCVLLLILLVGAGIVGVVQYRKIESVEQKERLVQKAAEVLMEDSRPMRERHIRLTKQIHELEAQVRELQAENHKLRQQLKGAGE